MQAKDIELFLSFKEFFDNAVDSAILVLDTEGNILKSSQGMKRSYGYDHKDVVGRNFSMLFIEDDLQKKIPEREIKTVMEKKAVSDINYILHKNGSKIWSHGESVLTKDKDGNEYIIKHFYDINHRKQLEENLLEANEKLTKAKKDLDTFVYTASHDLKAPISNLQALVSALEADLNDNAKKEGVADILKMIHESTERFTQVLNDLSVTGKAQSEETESPSQVHFAELVEEVKTSMLDQIEREKAVFLEDFSGAPSIKFSKKNLRSILYNLISNAIKFRSTNRNPEVRVCTYKHKGHVEIVVQDNGIGMHADQKEKVFQIYSRLHDHVEGTGVGMNIVKQIVDNNGGRIEVDSEPGKGSAFKVFLNEVQD